jgi:hypothetical protein
MRQARACTIAVEEELLQPDSLYARVARARSGAPDATLAELAADLELARSSVQRALAEIERRVAAAQVGAPSTAQPLR